MKTTVLKRLASVAIALAVILGCDSSINLTDEEASQPARSGSGESTRARAVGLYGIGPFRAAGQYGRERRRIIAEAVELTQIATTHE